MKRLLPTLCVLGATGLVATVWWRLYDGAAIEVAVPTAPPAAAGANPGHAADVLRAGVVAARQSCDVARFTSVIDGLRARVATAPDDRDGWHCLAEACLERALCRSHDRGLAIGTPTWSRLPREVAEDVEAGLAAVQQARRHGDDGADLHRIEAALLGQRITGLASALQWNGKIQTALQAAGERAPDDARLHVAIGLRKLLAPKLLGHDAAGALRHFEFAAQALPDDERPAVFAAMASQLQHKRQEAIAWLEQAVARNGANRFAKVVLQRLRAGEDDPFGRDVTAADAAATK
jgi:hypothetical protein